jgi:hypothetical protein
MVVYDVCRLNPTDDRIIMFLFDSHMALAAEKLAGNPDSAINVQFICLHCIEGKVDVIED